MAGNPLLANWSDPQQHPEALPAREAEYLRVNTLADAIVSTDAGGVVTGFNPAAERVFGYAADAILGEPVTMLMPERLREANGNRLERFLATGEAHVIGSTVELIGRRGDGAEFPLELSLSSADAAGETSYAAIVRDIGDRKQSEEAMSQLAAIVESSNDAIIGRDLNGTIVSWNGSAERIYGYTADEIIGLPMSILMAPEETDELTGDILEAVRRGERIDHYETVRVRKDGTRIGVSTTVSPIKDALGRITGASLVSRDVTERKRAEDKFRGLLEAAPDAIVIVGPEGRIALVNRQTEELFGYAREELLDQTVERLVPERFRNAHRQDRGGYFARPRTRPMGAGLELYGLHCDGSEFPIEISLSPLQTEEGVLVSAAIRDITERKRVEEELRRSNEALEQFASAASHDLSEPLRVIAGFVELLARRYEGRLDEEADRFIHYTVEAVERMQVLIDDLLDYSRAASTVLEPDDVDTAALVDEVLGGFAGSIAERRVRVDVGELPTLRAERALVRQVFQNLIGNAVKFATSEQPQVRISSSQVRNGWRFDVADNGPGIDPRYAKRVFEMFQRLHGPETPGTGIGLAIAKRLIERHGGSIWVEQAAGGGSVFSFTILGLPA